jgi:hypothetical protein
MVARPYDGIVPQSSGSPPRPPMVAAGPPTSTLAILSLVFGIVSYFALPLIGAIAAVVTGHVARAQIRRTGEGGAGLALAGLVLGYVHLALFAIGIAILIIVLLAVGGFFLTHKGH